MGDVEQLLAQVSRRPPDTAAQGRLVDAAGVPLPEDYLAFMAASDGGDGDVGDGWIEVWPVSQVLSELDSGSRYEGVMLFAGDGANTVYGFDRDGGVVEGDWIGLSRDEMIYHGSFPEFLRSLASRQG
jgi:hypothetical protein